MPPTTNMHNKPDSGVIDNIETTTGTVLIIDDEVIIRQLAEKILKKAGYNVITACSGDQGVEIFQRNHNDINVVILDMSMPGLSGKETLVKIKSEFPDANILMSTGHSIDGDLAKYIEDGMCGVLQKPYRAQQLCSVVENIIKK